MSNLKVSLAALATAIALPMSASAITISPDAANTLIDGANHILPGSFDYTAQVSSSVAGVDTDTATVSFQLSSSSALAIDLEAIASTLELPGGSMDMSRVALTTGEDFAGSVISEFSINDGGNVELATDSVILSSADFLAGVWFSISVTNVEETQQLNAQIIASEVDVPLPASAILLLGALGGLGFVRARARS